MKTCRGFSPRAISLALCLSVVASAVACLDQRPIVVVVGDMNNAGGDFGHHFADGVSSALLDELVRVEYVDDADEPKRARDQAASIVQDPRVVLVIGHSASATTIAASPVYAEAGVALMAPIATMDDLFAGSIAPVDPAVFRLPPPNRYQARAIVRHLLAEATEQLVVVYSEDNAYSTSVEKQLSTEWAAPKSYAAIDLRRVGVRPDARLDVAELSKRIKAAFQFLGESNRRALVVATYYREAIPAFKAAALVGREAKGALIRLGTDGTLHPGVGLPVGSVLVGVEFVFVGPSWQDFDPDHKIFDRYRRVHEQPNHPQREDQPTLWDAMWPSFIEFGYLAGVVAKDVIQEAKNTGVLNKTGVLRLLRSRTFDTGVKPLPKFAFSRSATLPAVMEPEDYIITVHRVHSVQPARRLDALWLKQVAHYTPEQLR